MKDQIKMILFVVILGIVASAILVGTDSYTKGMISDNVEFSLKSTILNAFEIEFSDDNVSSVYNDNIKSEDIAGATYYYSNDGSIGFEVSGKGLWVLLEAS